jgi:glycolate oxidase iron-sulfur subunit
MTIGSDNAKEEIKEIIEKCMKCGLCKQTDAVYKVMREEQFSPRGKIIILENEDYDEKIFYMDTLSGACEKICPLGIKMHEAVMKARKVLAERNKAPKEAKEIIKNLEKSGNIFGESE